MKICPDCQEQFDDRQMFCDQDGAALLDQTDTIRQALHSSIPRQQSSSAWVTGLIGGFVGVLVCVLLYMLFLAVNPRTDLDGQDRRPSQPQETAPVRSTQTVPAPLGTPPPVEPLPEEEQASASPTPVEAVNTSPAPQTAAALNDGPIATGSKEAREGGRAIIKMKDGSSVEADAAWEDSQGVWYRRSGLVSFVERSRVESITDPPQRQPAKSDVQTP